MNKTESDQFGQAFTLHVSGPVAECDCGRVFWDAYNTGYDWDEGETDRLSKNPNATAVNWGVERIMLEGTVYCTDCDCWHKRAQMIVDWMRENQSQIGEWFRLEKKRLEQAAKDVPVIEPEKGE